MLVRTFALWSALGVSVASAGAFLLPAPAARGGSSGASPIAVDVEPSSGGSHFLDGKALLLDGRLGHASMPRDGGGGAGSTFVLATVTGADVLSDDRPPPAPAHLAIVVDRSGSMAGLKMSNAVAAAVGVIERMRDGDRATVVAFDTTARVLVPPTTVDGASRPAIEAAIRAMRAGGDTCISCALDRATEALDSSPGPRDEVRKVLLISDGEATTGIRDVGGLRALASRARDRGFSVSTIGVDLAFDERVMAAIAQESNGRHYFVPDPGALAQVFDEELGAIESAVAVDAELVIEPAPGVTLDQVFDRSFRREGGRLIVPVGAFDARQEKTVLLSARVPTGASGVQQVARLSLAYRDVIRRQDARCAGTLSLEVRDDGTSQRELDPFVAARVERSRTTHALLEANELFSRGHTREARAELDRRRSELAMAAPKAVAQAATLPPSPAVRDTGADFGAQEQALAQAQASFGAAASAAAAGAQPMASPVARSAVKANQANASDLGF